jgi:thymidylate synthase (FAD)
MQVELVAYTAFNDFRAGQVSGYIRQLETGNEIPSEMDELGEFAGRLCYLSWNRPNPKTASNRGYLANIIDQQHFSVLEHANATLYVSGVSRSLLTELERHRFLSFSVVSQRYVPHDGVFIVPPAIRDLFGKDDAPELWSQAVQDAQLTYEELYRRLVEHGLPRKQAREAARSVLPNASEVRMVVTGNVRTWREIIQKRSAPGADAEIKIFAEKVLDILGKIAPNSVQDLVDGGNNV